MDPIFTIAITNYKYLIHLTTSYNDGYTVKSYKITKMAKNYINEKSPPKYTYIKDPKLHKKGPKR